MDETFYRTLFPPRVRVLGHWLPPLSFWHLACLHAIGSPFVRDTGDITLADVQLAVKCCLTPWPRRPDLRPTLRDLWQRLRHDRDPGYVRAASEAFALHRSSHEMRPEFWEHEGASPRFLTAPAILARVAQLERLTKFTHAEAWDQVTPGYAAWLTSTIIEQTGVELRFKREDDETDDGLPDLTQLDEAALFEIVKKDVGEEDARAWLERRRERAQQGEES